METLLIKNARIVNEETVSPASVFCHDGRFSAAACGCRAVYEYDADGQYLVPGFIDLHIHGVLGKLADTCKSSLKDICSLLPQFGVTGFLAALTPCADDIALLQELSSIQSCGSGILGFFLEGHYLKLSGAIKDIKKDYSAQRVHELIKAAQPYRLVFGVSPEIQELIPLLPIMAESGYPAFITHTCANYNETAHAISLGARHATHFYNVFPYPGDKEPGVRGLGAVEAILADPSVTVDFILDGEHVEPAVVKMAINCKGIGSVSLITDANSCAGLPPGTYKGLGGEEIVVGYTGGPARMSETSWEPGGLTGSGLTMDRAVRNAVRMLGLDLPQAVRMASLNPAAVLGLQDRKGRIAPGYDADFSILNDDLEIQACFVAGKKVYHSNK